MPKQQNDDNIFDELDESAGSEFNDETTQQKDSQPATKNSKMSFKDKVLDLWKNPKKRKISIATLVAALTLLLIVPTSRYFILNTVGVRSSASIKILDQSTSQPLRNVKVKLAGKESITDETGTARFDKLKLGKTKLQTEKRAFANADRAIVIGWGSNPLGETLIQPVGVQYKFLITDFLSNKPIEKIEAVSGEFSAFSDTAGLVVITIEDPGEDKIEITLRKEGYREEIVSQETENKDTQPINMVPSKKHVFISKRSGKYDLYKIDIDGKNEQLILSGSGNERSDIALVPHSNKEIVALVSTRSNERNEDGYLLSSLTLIDMSDNESRTTLVDMSEKFQVIGWVDNKLIFVKMTDGESAYTPNRHRLISYDVETEESKTLASGNYFNDVLMIGKTIYYAVSSANTKETVGLMKIDADGSNYKVIFDQETWNIIRTDYDKLAFSVSDDWYEYDLESALVLASSGPPTSELTRMYVDGIDDKKSLWVDQRDGKGALIFLDKEKNEEDTIKSQSGLTYPLRWINDTTIVYRIKTDQEIADYVASINGGESKKIADVTETDGIERWYYY